MNKKINLEFSWDAYDKFFSWVFSHQMKKIEYNDTIYDMNVISSRRQYMLDRYGIRASESSIEVVDNRKYFLFFLEWS